MALSSTSVIIGKDLHGNVVPVTLYNTGLTDDQGNALYQLGSAVRPTDVGGLGAYSLSMISGTIAAGLAANSPVFSFRWAPATASQLALIKRISVSVASLGTGFTAGVGLLALYIARGFTASDTGGTAATLTGNNNKLRTAFGTTGVANLQIANTGTLTPGTRTLDAQAIAQVIFGVSTATNTVMQPSVNILQRDQSAGDWPVVLANNEGLILQATVPVTGTWQLQIGIDWLEVAGF